MIALPKTRAQIANQITNAGIAHVHHSRNRDDIIASTEYRSGDSDAYHQAALASLAAFNALNRLFELVAEFEAADE